MADHNVERSCFPLNISMPLAGKGAGGSPWGLCVQSSKGV